MIKSFTIYKGYRGLFTNKLYKTSDKKPRTFNFTDRLNIVTGRNGSGKSVLLKLMTMATGNIDKNISPEMVQPLYINKGFFTGEYYTIQELINKKLSGTEEYGLPKVDIDWDGAITNYITPAFYEANNLFKRNVDVYEGFVKHYKDLYNGIESIGKFLSYDSAGENLIRTISRISKLPREYHKVLEEGDANDSWIKSSQIFQEWVDKVRKDPENEKPTILIDELDVNLDLDNQIAYFMFLKDLSKYWQIIVVSHSYFAFKLKDVNYINLNKDYFNKIRKL